LQGGGVDLNIPNLGYKKDSGFVFNPVRPLIQNLDDLPLPDRDMFSGVEDFKSSMLYLCGRGCTFKCTFCANSVFRDHYSKDQRWVRIQSVDRCFEELNALRDKYDTKTFQIQDDVFMLNKKWMREFCERYPSEVGVPFQVTGYPSIIREEDIRLLKEAGCFFLQVGVQSLNAENRKKILLRHETNEHVANCIDWCRKYDLGISIDYIFFPWESNEEDQLAAARFFHEHPPSRIANFYLTYLPGTAIINYALGAGYLEEKDMEGIKAGRNAHYHAGGVFKDEKETRKFFDNFYNFFIFLIIFPKSFGPFLFRTRAYKYARFFPKTPLIIIKELVLTLISKRFATSPVFFKYFKYYTKNIGSLIFGAYK
ncbi:MAG: radical SAM protein, partial [Planctomycetota bacterium]|nr:radical SAM protein [Planctomycetota bacterium]